MSFQPPADPVKMLDAMLRGKLEVLMFETPDKHTLHLRKIAGYCLRHHSLDSLGCDLHNYKNIFDFTQLKTERLTCYDASIIINGFNKLTPKETGLEVPEYLAILEIQNEVSTNWNLIVNPIHASCMKEVKAKTDRKIEVVPGNNLTATNFKHLKKGGRN